MIYTFEESLYNDDMYILMGYQVLQGVIYKYNYPPNKISGLKVNINQINTQINMK